MKGVQFLLSGRTRPTLVPITSGTSLRRLTWTQWRKPMGSNLWAEKRKPWAHRGDTRSCLERTISLIRTSWCLPSFLKPVHAMTSPWASETRWVWDPGFIDRDVHFQTKMQWKYVNNSQKGRSKIICQSTASATFLAVAPLLRLQFTALNQAVKREEETFQTAFYDSLSFVSGY